MDNKKYIGARYTIKIYENSLDPSLATWESGVMYEPITLVIYNLDSYLSKREVPPTIGNPEDNPTYWVKTGYTAAQLSNLQDQIDTINNTVIPGLQGQIDTINNTDIPGLQGQIDTINDTDIPGLQGQIDTINSNLSAKTYSALGYIVAGGSKTISFSNSSIAKLTIAAATSETGAEIICNCDSVGYVFLQTIWKSSNVSLTTGTRSLTIANNSSSVTFSIYALPLYGAKPSMN